MAVLFCVVSNKKAPKMKQFGVIFVFFSVLNHGGHYVVSSIHIKKRVVGPNHGSTYFPNNTKFWSVPQLYWGYEIF